MRECEGEKLISFQSRKRRVTVLVNVVSSFLQYPPSLPSSHAEKNDPITDLHFLARVNNNFVTGYSNKVTAKTFPIAFCSWKSGKM
jgi:hypothetical protein